LEQIIVAQRRGGVLCYHKGNEILCFPAVPFIAADNKEAHTLAHVKLNAVKRPCRFCTAEKLDLHKFNVQNKFLPRSHKDLEDNMNSKDWCEANSIHWDVSNVSLENSAVDHI